MSRLSRLLFGRRSKKSNAHTREHDSIDKQKLPVHVAVIMDGNGRWAKAKGLPRSAGHRAGVERVRTIIRMSSDIGIKHLSLYAFSTENWKRPKAEVSTLMKLLLEYLRDELSELNAKNVCIKTFGDLSRLPNEVRAEVDRSVKTTRNNSGLTVNMAINYGSRQEIVSAMKKAVEQAKSADKIDEKYVSSLLDSAGQPDPDLMIRTSGEMRMSNYLMYQLAYAELYFTDIHWPDFDEKQYAAALNNFAKRDRRFGGV